MNRIRGKRSRARRKPLVPELQVSVVRCAPLPEFITCTRCGYETEFWSEGDQTLCEGCGHRFFRREATVH